MINTTNDRVSQGDTLIKARHSQYKRDGELYSTENAILNQPERDMPLIAPFLEPTTSSYNTLLADIHAVYNPQLQVQLGCLAKEEADKKIRTIRQQVAPLYAKNQERKNQYSGQSFFWPVILFILGMLGSAFMVSAEWNYIAESVQVIANTHQTAFFLAAGICLSTIAISHLLPVFLREKIENRLLRNAIMGIAILVVCAVFLLLAKLRSDYLKAMQGIDTPIWGYFLITSLLFVALYLCSEMMLAPLWADVRAAFITLANKIAIVRDDAKIKRMDKQIVGIESELSTQLQERLTLIHKAKQSEALIDSLYLETVSHVKNTNINKRTDGVVPTCFSQLPPPLRHFNDDVNL